MLLSFPAFLAVLVTPFPYAWIFIFIAVFFMFSNTGPMNTVLANVVPGHLRASGFAIHILIIHALGDAVSPVLIGYMRDQRDLSFAFLVIAALIPVAAVFWLLGARHLQPDTERAEAVA
jgi:predicted MFS family arabinose efflux permease